MAKTLTSLPGTKKKREYELKSQPRKHRHISVDLTEAEKDKIVELARRSGLRVSDYLRALLHDTLKDNPTYEMTVQYSRATKPPTEAKR